MNAARTGAIKHIVAYHPDRLMRQPKDLEQLLTIADDADIMLHGQANRRDLSDADDRFFLRIEVAHACRSSDDTSRRLKAAMIDQANDGKPHSGRRRYGYDKDAVTQIPAEAQIVREIFARYLDGDSPRTIAADLNARGVPTMTEKKWETWRVMAVLDSRHVAGIRVFHEEEIGRGTWEPIIDEGTFAEAAERRTVRARATKNNLSPGKRFYLLRGLVTCSRCGVRMNGTGGGYMCSRMERLDDAKCTRTISGPRLEEFVVDAAIHVLENLHITIATPTTAMSDTDRAAAQATKTELADLKEMWTAQELSTREYRQMRAVLDDRLSALQARTVIRPTASILKGITGPNARTAWQDLGDTGQGDRQNAILRFLFAAVIIGANTTAGRFDYSRIQVEPNSL